MRAQGATIVDPIALPASAQLGSCEMVVLLHEFKAGLDAHLGAREPQAGVRSLSDVIAFNERERDREMIEPQVQPITANGA